MKSVCPGCGKKVKYGTPFCPRCGQYIPLSPSPAQPMPPAAQSPAAAQDAATQRLGEPPVQPTAPRQYSAPVQQPQKRKKRGGPSMPGMQPVRRKKKHGFLRFLLVLLIIFAVLALCWFCFGNMITLHFHSQKVLDHLNSGDLDLPGVQSTDFSTLPHYMQGTLSETLQAQENGPIMEAVLPRLRAERVSIHGFFGRSTVEYKISAPDLESWLLDQDPAAYGSSDQLLSAMLDYIPQAPLRSQTVTVDYSRDGLFGWQGSYQTTEFADAVSGGLNSAYSALYAQMLEELEDALG